MIEAFGPVANLPNAQLDEHHCFKVAFDIAEAAEPGQINRRIESAARYLNMHARQVCRPRT